MIEFEYPFWAWLTFFGVLFAALFVDIGIVNRGAKAPSRKQTVIWSFIWVSLALAFNAFVYWVVSGLHDQTTAFFKAKEFFTGYLIELSLSIDNLFVFLLIFKYFKVPKKYQHRVLFWGILMAMVMRLVMIFAGAQLVESFNWILYFFGAFLIYTGISMFGEDEAFEPENSSIIKLTTKYVRIARHYDDERFFVTIDGKRTGTLLLLVMIVINVADLVFAVDSIPAIFGITTDKFIVYTSNIFAILGLRTFYFLLADLAERFHLLKYGLAFVLSFIGFKMLLPLFAQGLIMIYGADSSSAFVTLVRRYEAHEFEHLIINVSLAVVIGAILLAVVLSLIFPPKPSQETHNSKDPSHGR